MGRVINPRQTSKTGKFGKSNSKKTAHASANAPPKRVPNSERRSHEYLTPDEIKSMIAAVKKTGRNGHRDSTLILLTYRHALRVGEVVSLRRDQVDLERNLLHVNRLRNGTPSVHPLQGPEIQALRKLFREYPGSPYVFVSERKGPMTTSRVRKTIERGGVVAGIGFHTHPNQLRHATGYYLASKGHDNRSIQRYMGYKKIEHTVRYTKLSPERFKSFWRD